MILVKRQPGISNAKLVKYYLNRVKKSNKVARFRKTRRYTKPISKRQQKAKALRIVKYQNEHNRYRMGVL